MIRLKKPLHKRRVSQAHKALDSEEILWDAMLQKNSGGTLNSKIEIPLTERVLKGFNIVFFIFLGVIIISCVWFQLFRYKEFSTKAQNNKFVITSLTAQRGVIYDRNYDQLVFNKPTYALIFDKDVENSDFEKISWILDKDVEKIVEESDDREVIIAQDIDYDTLVLINSNLMELPGFSLKNVDIRKYKLDNVFSHVLGYHRLSGENQGLESTYNDFLSPVLGERQEGRDVYGNILSEEIITQPEPGDSLVLYLDSKLQEKLYETMKFYMKNVPIRTGVAIAQDPKTGGVLAMASFPDYNNNLFSEGISTENWNKLINDPHHPFLNRVISGKYATGSVIKPLIASAALEEGVIKDYDNMFCDGKIIVENPWYEDKPWIFNDWRTHGWVDIRKAIAESCNVFFYTIGGGNKDIDGLGAERIKEYLDYFGWETELGIDLPGEIVGFVPDKAWKQETLDTIWMPGDTYNLSIGQGFLGVTPLEINNSFVSLVNGGDLLKPRLVDKIISQDKKVVEDFGIEIIGNIPIDQDNLNIVMEGMKGTVEYGTASSLSRLPVTAGAKTGTAQAAKDGYYHNWITVFAPYDDPEIVMTLMVENVQELYTVVLPTARDVLSWYFAEEIIDN